MERRFCALAEPRPARGSIGYAWHTHRAGTVTSSSEEEWHWGLALRCTPLWMEVCVSPSPHSQVEVQKPPASQDGTCRNRIVTAFLNSEEVTLEEVGQSRMTGVLTEREHWGAPVAQSVKHPELGFGSGCSLSVLGSSPVSGLALSGESAGGSLSRPLSPRCSRVCAHTLSPK